MFVEFIIQQRINYYSIYNSIILIYALQLLYTSRIRSSVDTIIHKKGIMMIAQLHSMII